MSLPDGAFPRVNASMIHSGEYVNCIASVVGMPVSFDGEATVEFECVDGGRVQVIVPPEFAFVPGKAMEVMGAVQDDKSVQVRVVTHDVLFVTPTRYFWVVCMCHCLYFYVSAE
jgi:hypothetical protein